MTGHIYTLQDKAYHRFEIEMAVLGLLGIVLPGDAMIHIDNYIMKGVFGIIAMDSIYLFWCAVQDLYFYYKEKFFA